MTATRPAAGAATVAVEFDGNDDGAEVTVSSDGRFGGHHPEPFGYPGPVRTRPDDLADRQVAEAVLTGWGVAVDKLEYAAVGFGSHHWCAAGQSRRWFITVDDMEAKRLDGSETYGQAQARLAAALGAARSLRDGGLDFVVAPLRSKPGNLLASIGERYQLALYPHVDGEIYEWGSFSTRVERFAVIDRLIRVHGATEQIDTAPPVDRLGIPRRLELEATLADPGSAWGPGPYAKLARHLMELHTESLLAALARYDELAAVAAGMPGRFVVTHGEPHRANTIGTSQGVMLIDWDTTLLAPPERDLWMLIGEDTECAAYYSKRSGTDLDETAIALYGLWWDLCEVSLFSDDFRKPHLATEDNRTGWDGLNRHLEAMNRSRWSDQ